MIIGAVYQTRKSRVFYIVISVGEHACKIRSLGGRKQELIAPAQYLQDYFDYCGRLS